LARRSTTSSNTYRFFVPPESLRGDDVQIDDADLARQLGAVLRLGPGDQVVLLDGLGLLATVELLAITRHGVRGAVVAREHAGNEPRLSVTLYVGLMRAERFEWVLQKGTELGAAAFVPVQCARSAADGQAGASKQARWARIVREAAEQSRRGRLPQIHAPLAWGDACASAAGPALMLWEGAGAAPIRAALRRHAGATQIALISGPEGGITDDERAAAERCGVAPVTLGPRTLRAETAPIVAATAALYEAGDLD
jgi:16S rRNA (uracil1498-N3)-methyltransferase